MKSKFKVTKKPGVDIPYPTKVLEDDYVFISVIKGTKEDVKFAKEWNEKRNKKL